MIRIAHKPRSRRLRLRRILLALAQWLGRPRIIVAILAVLLLIVAAGATVLSAAEQALGGEPAFASWAQAFWYMLSAVGGIGIGAKTPQTEFGRSIAIVGGVLGSALKGVFTAAVASTFVNRLILEGKGLGDYDLRGHILICGWNHHIHEVLRVLEEQAFGHGVEVVLLADMPENPVPKTHVRYLRGDPTLDSDLERAAAQHAQSAIILADESRGVQDESTTDARTVLTALALETVNPNIYTIAEVRDPANRRHFARTKTDELIASQELTGGLLARTAVNPGVGRVFSTLVRLDKSAEVYITPAPAALAGKSFDEALRQLREEQEVLVIGIALDRDVMLNPGRDYTLREGDCLVVITNARPAR